MLTPHVSRVLLRTSQTRARLRVDQLVTPHDDLRGCQKSQILSL